MILTVREMNAALSLMKILQFSKDFLKHDSDLSEFIEKMIESALKEKRQEIDLLPAFESTAHCVKKLAEIHTFYQQETRNEKL